MSKYIQGHVLIKNWADWIVTQMINIENRQNLFEDFKICRKIYRENIRHFYIQNQMKKSLKVKTRKK